ncbi:SIR2 family protein [Bacillus toyonensis]|uniref:SIR2 family protein n=1 Tax=Bacillus toyonensis TaxID=155322 RepID=UPI000BED4776|nr:SIR2 family protein [Bacillus toyonensis]PEB27528.1 SIR2 family protein [Bacillus toyonensis]PED77551.1 SIR2 family protein [Bacillus toyonensis]PHD81840.1 SIR2 family protein [Bacillus toyonensis]
MSLEHLIDIVRKEFSLTQECILNKLEILISVGQIQTFSKKTLKGSGLAEKEINFLIEYLVSEKLINKSYSYECQRHENHEITDDFTSDCEFCEEKINDSSTHIILELYELEEEFIKMVNMKQEEILKNFLQEEYMDNYTLLSEKIDKLVPFLGSGVSIPLGLPDWKGLIGGMKEKLSSKNDQDYFEVLIHRGDLLGALEMILNYSSTLNTGDRIKAYISEKIRADFKDKVDEGQHNIRDIMNLTSDFVLTTNYDNALSVYRQEYNTPSPIDDIEELQELFGAKQKKVIHFHGMIDRRSTMIVTRDDYEELYASQKTKNLLNGIMAGKFLIFIGFSFQDEYFHDLYTKIRGSIGGEHFIIIPNLHPQENRQLSARGLRPIGIKVPKEDDGRLSQQGYVDALKYIINRLI